MYIIFKNIYISRSYFSCFVNITANEYLIKDCIQSHYRPEVPRAFQEVTVPRLCDSGPECW